MESSGVGGPMLCCSNSEAGRHCSAILSLPSLRCPMSTNVHEEGARTLANKRSSLNLRADFAQLAD